MRCRLLLLLVLAACGGNPDPTSPPPPPPGPPAVFSVTLSRDTATVVPRQTVQLVAVLRDQANNVLTGRTMGPGTHSVTATYLATGSLAPSTASLQQVVNP